MRKLYIPTPTFQGDQPVFRISSVSNRYRPLKPGSGLDSYEVRFPGNQIILFHFISRFLERFHVQTSLFWDKYLCATVRPRGNADAHTRASTLRTLRFLSRLTLNQYQIRLVRKTNGSNLTSISRIFVIKFYSDARFGFRRSKSILFLLKTLFHQIF